MAYIVLDMEWNQNGIHQKCPVNKSGKLLKNEIIQIGAVQLDNALQFVDTFKASVRLPGKRTLNKHVARVVVIDEHELKKGIDFCEAIKQFRAWCGRRPIFLIWGFDDIAVLKHNLEYYGLPQQWVERWYNAQMIYSSQFLEQRQQVSLSAAADRLGLELNLPAHDAFNDALLTAMICQKLDIAKGISTYAHYMKPAVKKTPVRRRPKKKSRAPTPSS